MSDDTVTPFRPKDGLVGNGIVIDPDQILENAKGAFDQLVVLGFNKDGEIDVRCSHGAHQALWAIARAHHHVLMETGHD